MNKFMKAGLALALASATIFAAGCSTSGETEESSDSEVWGYVAGADAAQLEITEDQDGVDTLVVDRALAPDDAWIVVHADDNGKPGMRVGLARIEKGESTDVKVELEDLTTPNVIVAMHADRGEAEEFDFDMMNAKMSPDRPYFVDGKELAKVVTVREFGIETPAGTAAIEVSDQAGAKESLTIDKAVAPAGAWVVVHLDDEGAPGARVGLLQIPSGESTGLTVELDPLPLTAKVFVAVHADAAEPGVFEFDMMNKINSADQPYFVDGEEVATVVGIK